MDIEKQLFLLKDEKYRQFSIKLIPNIDPERVLGVRIPVLRKFAKELSKSENVKPFLSDLPHKYYDENNLHAFLICEIKDYDEVVFELERFLPYVDNWSTCDVLSPKVFKKNLDKLIVDIKRWISSKEPYTIRFGIEILMTYFLDEHFKKEYLEEVAKIRSEEYYVNMMIAWFFATALTKQYDKTLPYLQNNKLQKWVHNKTIQKAKESFCITDSKKEYLKSLKIK